MCYDSTSDSSCSHNKRRFRQAGGKLVQCLGCGSIGVEFGTSYLVFSEADFFRFARWFETLRWEDADIEKDRIFIRMHEDGSVMLALSRQELKAVSNLLSEGTRWVASSGLITDQPNRNLPSLSSAATVH